jgi:hypothetical protein
MVPSGMLCRVALVRTDISEELSAYFIRVTIIGELGTALAVTSNRRTHGEDTILYSHRRENLKSYIFIKQYKFIICISCVEQSVVVLRPGTVT